MKKLYWYNLIVFVLLVLVPQVFGFFYRQRSYDESRITVQYIILIFIFLAGILLVYKNIKFIYCKKENDVKYRTLHKVIVSSFIFLGVILTLVGLFFLAMQYGLRGGVGL